MIKCDHWAWGEVGICDENLPEYAPLGCIWFTLGTQHSPEVFSLPKHEGGFKALTNTH